MTTLTRRFALPILLICLMLLATVPIYRSFHHELYGWIGIFSTVLIASNYATYAHQRYARAHRKALATRPGEIDPEVTQRVLTSARLTLDTLIAVEAACAVCAIFNCVKAVTGTTSVLQGYPRWGVLLLAASGSAITYIALRYPPTHKL